MFIGDVDPTILISIRTPNNSAISDFCGLCGSRSGSLLRRDGTEADATSMAEVQSFISSYAVPARDQILRPQRRECGKLLLHVQWNPSNPNIIRNVDTLLIQLLIIYIYISGMQDYIAYTDCEF